MPMDSPPPPPVMAVAPPPLAAPAPQASPSDPLAPPGSPLARFWIWTPGAASCAGKPLDLSGLERPDPTSMQWTTGTATITFRIDAQGRPRSIVPQMQEAAIPYGYRVLSPWLDLEPSLAASHFPAGAPRNACRIDYTLRPVEFAEATLGEKLEWSVSMEGALNQELALTRLLAGDSSCNEELYPRVLHYAPFDQMPSRPGHTGKILLFFDVGADGVPTDIRAGYSSATPQATAESIAAAGRSRFAPKAAKGCVRIDLQAPDKVIAPPAPIDPAVLRPKDSDCPTYGNELLDVADVPYPEGFQRRGIEGWAIVGFDIVPGRGVTRVTALRAEPAAAFGVQAEEVVRAAKPRSGERAYHGCVARILFKLPESGPYGVFNGVR